MICILSGDITHDEYAKAVPKIKVLEDYGVSILLIDVDYQKKEQPDRKKNYLK